jgi:hypothetical protein
MSKLELPRDENNDALEAAIAVGIDITNQLIDQKRAEGIEIDIELVSAAIEHIIIMLDTDKLIINDKPVTGISKVYIRNTLSLMYDSSSVLSFALDTLKYLPQHTELLTDIVKILVLNEDLNVKIMGDTDKAKENPEEFFNGFDNMNWRLYINDKDKEESLKKIEVSVNEEKDNIFAKVLSEAMSLLTKGTHTELIIGEEGFINGEMFKQL